MQLRRGLARGQQAEYIDDIIEERNIRIPLGEDGKKTNDNSKNISSYGTSKGGETEKPTPRLEKGTKAQIIAKLKRDFGIKYGL